MRVVLVNLVRWCQLLGLLPVAVVFSDALRTLAGDFLLPDRYTSAETLVFGLQIGAFLGGMAQAESAAQRLLLGDGVHAAVGLRGIGIGLRAGAVDGRGGGVSADDGTRGRRVERQVGALERWRERRGIGAQLRVVWLSEAVFCNGPSALSPGALLSRAGLGSAGSDWTTTYLKRPTTRSRWHCPQKLATCSTWTRRRVSRAWRATRRCARPGLRARVGLERISRESKDRPARGSAAEEARAVRSSARGSVRG